ncbi:hypothetical protein TWF718_003485 [Orbilia javanica]|uniref:Uncharacterized protein n=1 Tax=Orbilia javanica TaxID=47235 RepID=A0AAN8RBG4_9PEZI
MKFFGSSTVAFCLLGSFFASAAVIPVDKPEGLAPLDTPLDTPALDTPALKTPVDTLLDVKTVTVIVQNVYIKVQEVTGKINETVAGVKDPANALERVSAARDINIDITKITVIISGAITELQGGAAEPTDIPADLGNALPTDLPRVFALLVLEVSGTLTSVISVLGLRALLSGALGGLVASLSGLIIAIIPAVGDILVLVHNILGGLPIELSPALAGLVV